MEYLATYSDEYIAHHGVKGQKWGVRRYQNADGSLTDEGKKRYGVDATGLKKRYTQNVRETGRRSARASAKASFKRSVGPSALLAGAGAALGVASVGGIAVSALPLVAIAAGTSFVASTAGHTALGAIVGSGYGKKVARQQDARIRDSVKKGESFVLEELTAVSAAGPTWYGTSVKTVVNRR